ncbi:hypothetical protein F183_A27920 [Bryobacterales bacterium F-183]|nr:hypothetical protein F183_A27920 [Bryobacterales bacterium F-183]
MGIVKIYVRMRFCGIGVYLSGETLDGLLVEHHPNLIPWTLNREHTVELAQFAVMEHLGDSMKYDAETARAVCCRMGWAIPTYRKQLDALSA